MSNFDRKFNSFEMAYGKPSSDDDSDSVSSSASDESSKQRKHPFIQFLVGPWSGLSYNYEKIALFIVIAKNEEECCDLLQRKHGGNRDDIMDAIEEAQTFRLEDPDQTSRIVKSILA